MVRLRGVWVGSLCRAAAIALFAPSTARADYTVTFAQVGADVVATGSGSFDLGALAPQGQSAPTAGVSPFNTQFVLGSVPAEGAIIYAGVIIGPDNFGTGAATDATSATGPVVAIAGTAGLVAVPLGYVSGQALTETATFADETFDTLGLVPGSYEFRIGSASGATRVSVLVGTAAVATPEPASACLLLSGLLGGIAARSRPIV